MIRKRTLKTILAGGACAMMLATAAAASSRDFNVPAGDPKAALDAYARQAGVALIYRADEIRGSRSAGVRGALEADKALARLLQGSGFRVERGPTGALAIVKGNDQPADAGSAESSELVDEVVVTARKREERLIDVPIAVSAFDEKAIERSGAKNLADFLQEAPGVGVYDSGNGILTVQIRGVSTSLGGNQNGYYLDDLPFTGVSVPLAPDVRAWDIQRVEVLRGPQGTLFGEGSLGGTVRILTNGANLNDFEVKGEGLYSNTKGGGDNTGFKGAVNLPIIPGKLAVRLAGTTEDYSGWVDDRATGRTNLNESTIDTFRAKVRFDPTEQLSLTAGYWKYSGDFPNGGSSATDDGQISQSAVLSNQLEYELFGATASYDFGPVSLFYSYSNNAFSLPQQGSLFGGTLLATIDIDVQSHELRAQSTGQGPLQWTVGVYQRTAKRRDDLQFALFGLDNQSITDTKAQAIFGEATYTLPFAPIDLTAGLRWFKDDLHGLEYNSTVPTVIPGDVYKSVNPRFSIAWRPTRDLNVYASAAKGFRSGQLQPTAALAIAQILTPPIVLPDALKQDSIWSYEVGAKADLFDRKLSLEGAIYYNDWKDVTVRLPLGTTGFNGLINSDGTETWGAEAHVVARPTPEWTFTAGASWVDATYAGPVPGTNIVTGAPVDDVAKWTANASADWRQPLNDNIVGIGRLSWQYTSPRSSPSFPLYTSGDRINRIDAQIGAEFKNWTLVLFADNLTDEDGATSYRSVSVLGPNTFDVVSPRLRPRTLGVRASFNFGGGQ
jgi:iron complex outermembrane receptor protein